MESKRPAIHSAPSILLWEDGPLEKGCVYHKRGALNAPFVSGQIDLFVMPRLARSRPIAITLNIRTLQVRKNTKLTGAISRPEEVTSLHKRLAPKLSQIGFSTEKASAVVTEICRFVIAEGEAINQALRRT